MRGFSTLELLVAMTIITLVISAVLLLSFGNQSLLADSVGNIEALSLASELLDTEEALAQKDFNLVVPTSTVHAIGSIVYQETVEVKTQSDYLTKKIIITVSWAGEYNRPQHITLGTYVTHFEDAFSASTCNAELGGNWSAPVIANPVQNFAQLVGDASGTYTLTGLDVYKGRLYVTASNSASGKETFFIFNTAGGNLVLLAKLDNDAKNNTGLAAVALASTTAGSYAYVAGALTSDQLQIIDIRDPSNLASTSIVATYKILASDVPNAGVGNAIFYKNGYVYLGLTKSGTGGTEFNIIDVHNPKIPKRVGGYSVGNGINALYVNGPYAYIASPNSQNLIVLDITNPAAPVLAGGYAPPNAPESNGVGSNRGESVRAVGDTVYLGRTYGTNELYLLHAATPAHIAVLGSKDTGTGNTTGINGIVVRSTVAFLLTNTALALYHVGDPANISAYAPPLTLPNANSGAALDCEGNTLYVASNDAAKHGYLYVIQAGL